ncbi:MAG: SPFH domain-containing protein [Myxococcota bacterium]|nr:SPFH domain-containing protein [Myxococcota bacterium]
MALIDVVKWDEPGDLLVWKFPSTELSTATQLIVNESQEALLFKDGQRCDTFGAGRYTLSTKNIPILNKLINLPFGGQSPFAAEVWYVNRTMALDIKWGTRTPIQLEDPQYGVVVPVRAFGQFGIQVVDSGKFVTKLVGATSRFDRQSLDQHFQGFMMSRLKTAIATAMVKEGIGILEIGAELITLGAKIEEALQPHFDEYGVAFKAFNIMSINVPEEDASYQALKHAKADAARRKIEGITYQQERSFDVMETAAGNEGGAAGTMMGAGMGIGLGFGVGNQAGGLVGQMATGGAPPPAPGSSPDNPVGGPGTAPARAFHIHLNGQQMGPYPIETLKQGVATGQFTRETMVWTDGMPQWTPAGQVPDLASLFGPPPFPGSGNGGPPPFPSGE